MDGLRGVTYVDGLIHCEEFIVAPRREIFKRVEKR